MTFGANLDNGDVGAECTAAWLYKEDTSNVLTAYYLFRDNDGVFFIRQSLSIRFSRRA